MSRYCSRQSALRYRESPIRRYGRHGIVIGIVDAVYARGYDLWTVVHANLDPGETQTVPEAYILWHVRREWLDFANRDLNTRTPLPDENHPEVSDMNKHTAPDADIPGQSEQGLHDKENTIATPK